MSGRLDGQVALVTGGGRGIGRAIGSALAAAGSRVALAARSGAELDEAVAEAEAALGPIMLLVRVAAGEADPLSGRFLHAEDDLDELLADAGRVVAEDLLTLRLRQRPEG
jgi:NAD(P)-dependent dehydrogenase (short-subunit alcohol dehydrogenase family)